MNNRTRCTLGILFFVTSYVFFSQGSLSAQKTIDLAHWFNLFGAVFLLFFNRELYKENMLHALASLLTGIGVIAHIGLCTIDFIMWSYGSDAIGRNVLSEQIAATPTIVYPFVLVGPALLFVGLAMHALNYGKTYPLASLMVILGGPMVGISYFVWNHGGLMLASCMLFATGLALLLYRDDLAAWRERRKMLPK